MSVAAAFPFQTLSDDLVRFSGWEIGDVGQALNPAGELLENWDYARDLEIAAEISVDWNAASKYLQVPPSQLGLRVVLLAGTGTGRLPRTLQRIQEQVLSERTTTVRLGGAIHATRLSGQLRLALIVLLERAPEAAGKLSPKIPGSRLWQSSHDILIEDGGASRFPIEAASFSKAFKGTPMALAPWYLHWDPYGLQSDFSEQVRLYLNSDREEIFGRFKSGDIPTLQAILADVISQMTASILDLPDGEELLSQCDEGSVGAQIELWLRTAFPSEEFSSVRAIKDRFPGKFRASILGIAELQAEV